MINLFNLGRRGGFAFVVGGGEALPWALLWLGRSTLQEIIVLGSIMSYYQRSGMPYHVLFVFVKNSSL